MKFDKPILLNFDRLIMKQFLDDHQFILVDMEGNITQSNDTLFDLTEFINAPLDNCLPLLTDYFHTIVSNPELPIEINCIEFELMERTGIYDIKFLFLHELGSDMVLIEFYDRTLYYRQIQNKHQKKVLDYLDKQILINQAETIKKQNEEIKVLIKEAHHRIKNNLQIISSLIRLQTNNSKNDSLNQILLDVDNRIHSMALLHECLYKSQNLKNVNIREYIISLTNDLTKSYRLNKEFSCITSIEEVELNSKTLVTLGLLINELFTNALKHGLKGKEKGKITIDFKKLPDSMYQLTISDNGIGIPKDTFTKESNTLGVELIQIFTKQLGGTLSILDKPGTAIQITFTEEIVSA